MIIRLFFLLFRWVDRLRASPLQHRCRTIDTSIVALVQLCKHPHSLLRSQAHYESFNLQPLKRSKTDNSSSIFFTKHTILCLTLSSPLFSTLTYDKYASVGLQRAFLVIHQNIVFCLFKAISRETLTFCFIWQKTKKGLTCVSPFCMFVKISLFREGRFQSRCSSFWLQRQSFRQALR